MDIIYYLNWETQIKKYEERRDNLMESTTSSISLQAALQWMPMTTTTKKYLFKKNEQEQPNNIKLSTMTHIQPLLPHPSPICNQRKNQTF